jgi:hypothetical protein
MEGLFFYYTTIHLKPPRIFGVYVLEKKEKIFITRGASSISQFRVISFRVEPLNAGNLSMGSSLMMR